MLTKYSPSYLDQVYKSARLTPNGQSSRHARVDDEEEPRDEDVEAGPAPPPPGEDEDGDYGPAPPPDDGDDDNDDEEGRFFGGGITAQESEVLDYMNQQDESAGARAEKFDTAWLRKTALTFEKKISRNAEMRAKFEDDPQKFIASEADLDAEIKALSILAEHPDLYPEFARLGCAASLVGLLTHENPDIAIAAIQIIGELTDDEVTADDPQWAALVDALLDADLLGLLVSNLDRLNEAEDFDRAGVYYALGILENLSSGRQDTAERVAAHDGLLRWLLRRAQTQEAPVGQNKQYAAEVLAILVQTSALNRRRLAALDAVDAMLQLVAAYRKRDPEKGGDEEEYMENLFEALTCLVDEPEGKAKLVKAEGVELCLIMLREGKLSRPAALRLLDHATTASTSDADGAAAAATEVCRRLVEAGGLKHTFTLFMKKTSDGRTAEHLVGIFASLLRRLPADSAERIRTLAKFVEKDYEKTARLVSLRRDSAARLAAVDAGIRVERERLAAAEKTKTVSEEQKAALEDDWFSRRLDAGLFTLQTLDVVLAWLVAEDGAGAGERIRRLLADRDETLAVVRATLLEQIEGMDAGDGDGDGDGDGGETSDTREMLSTLAEFLQ